MRSGVIKIETHDVLIGFWLNTCSLVNAISLRLDPKLSTFWRRERSLVNFLEDVESFFERWGWISAF